MATLAAYLGEELAISGSELRTLRILYANAIDKRVRIEAILDDRLLADKDKVLFIREILNGNTSTASLS